VLFFAVKKPSFNQLADSLKSVRFQSAKIKGENLPELFGLFILVFSLSLTAFFIPANTIQDYDDLSYHLPIIYDFSDDGKKTFFAEPHNIYEYRSNQFPLLLESFTGVTNYFLGSVFFKFVPFFSLILSLFLIFFLSRLIGFKEHFSVMLFALAPSVLVFTRYFYTDIFLSMLFLGCVFFILNYLKTQQKYFIFVSGFLAGLMFLTKFTGVVFFIGLLLFLFYKKKFRESVLFSLIFVLVAFVFVSSHFGIPIQQITVGDYGKIASNPFIEIPSKAFDVAKILIDRFAEAYYIPFIPFLFLLALFWRTKNEMNLLVLFFISLIFFLFVNIVVNAEPTSTGFPRYFFPLYALLCVFSGIQLKKMAFFKDKRIFLFVSILFVLLMFLISIFVLSILVPESKTVHYSRIGGEIPNNSDVSVWFVNGAALKSRIDKAVLYDYSWQADFSGEPCVFLQSQEINYIVYFHIDKDATYLGEFGSKLRESLLKGECSELISESKGSLNSATFGVISYPK